MSRPCVLWLSLLASCASVQWLPRPDEVTWRGRTLWCSPDLQLVAHDASAAAEVHDVCLQLRDAFVALGEAPPPAPLVLVMDAGDEALLGDPVRTLAQIAAWQPAGEGRSASRTDVPPDALAELLRALATSVVSPVPLSAPELALPASWSRMASWAVVVPTAASVEAAADALLDHGLAAEPMSFGEKLLLAPLMPFVRSKARASLREHMLRGLVEAHCAVVEVNRPIPAATRRRLLRAMGVSDVDTPGSTSGAAAPPSGTMPR